MPATYAHYLFGRRVYAKLPADEQELIREGRDAFLLGLHGPDLLFYYYPFYKNRINQQGVRMHGEPALGFFEKGKNYYRKGHDPELRAYLYGFLCHFMLDSECHPYIEAYRKEQGIGHLELETEFDRYLMERDGLNPVRFTPVHHLISRAHTRREIASMFDRVTPRQIGVCIYQFRLIVKLLTCRSPFKGTVLRTLSEVTGQRKGIGGLIMDGRALTECRESDRFLERKLEHTVQPTVGEICRYSRVLDVGGSLSERLNRNYTEAPA